MISTIILRCRVLEKLGEHYGNRVELRRFVTLSFFLKSWALGCVVLLLVGFWLLPGIIHAQRAQATINGTVHDPSGAVIPDASVLLHNNGTNFDRPVTTNSVGAYVITNIQPGNYDLRVSKDGFTTSAQMNITLVVNETPTFDFSLTAGSMKETITVQAMDAALETSPSETGVALLTK